MYVSTSAQPRDAINNLGVYVQQQGTTCGFTGHDAWVVLSPIEQSIKRKIESVGKPLRDWDINIFRGVLTGYNDAFIITTERRDEILSNCKSGEERQRTNDIIRPILRGRDIKRYSYDWAGLWLINTHNGVKGKIPRIDINDYPAIKAHLDQFWDKIKTRADQGDTPYNLRNCAYSDVRSSDFLSMRQEETRQGFRQETHGYTRNTSNHAGHPTTADQSPCPRESLLMCL